MTVDQVRKKIKKKFGRYSKFCVAAGIDEYNFRLKFLAPQKVSKEDIHRYADLCESVEVLAPDIPDEKIEELRMAIGDKGGVIKFCRENTQFAEQSIFQILNGTRKKKTVKVIDIFKFFDIML